MIKIANNATKQSELYNLVQVGYIWTHLRSGGTFSALYLIPSILPVVFLSSQIVKFQWLTVDMMMRSLRQNGLQMSPQKSAGIACTVAAFCR